MKQLIFGILSTFIFLASTTLAQTNSVQITGGKFDIPGGNNVLGSALMQSNIFTSGSYLGTSGSPWRIVCQDYNCRTGSTFSLPNGLQIGDNGHRSGNFTINGNYYNNVYFSGGFQFEPVSFQIPKIARKKGSVTLRKSFKMDGTLFVCRINDFANGCPPNDILFRGDIYGHGDVTVTLRVETVIVLERYTTYLKPVRFEYDFKP